MKNPKKGQTVIVYDRYRFAIPLRALVVRLSTVNDGVQVQLMESNNPSYPIGCDNVWVSRRQLRKIPNMVLTNSGADVRAVYAESFACDQNST